MTIEDIYRIIRDCRNEVVKRLKGTTRLSEESLALYIDEQATIEASAALLPLLQQRETEWNYTVLREWPDGFRPVHFVLHSDHSVVETISHASKNGFGEYHRSEVYCWSYVIPPNPPQ